MKLLYKQRLFSWYDSYDIYDENGNTVYIVKGQLSWGHKLNIYNLSGEHIGTIKEDKITLQPRFALYIADRYVGDISRELSISNPKFNLNCKDWSVVGDCKEWNYTIRNSSEQVIMNAVKHTLGIGDSFEIDVIHPDDSIYALMVVLAIDIAKCE